MPSVARCHQCDIWMSVLLWSFTFVYNVFGNLYCTFICYFCGYFCDSIRNLSFGSDLSLLHNTWLSHKYFNCNFKNSLTSLFRHKVIVMQLQACKWDFTPSSNMSSKFNFVHVIFAYLTFVHLGAIIRDYLYMKNKDFFRNGTII